MPDLQTLLTLLQSQQQPPQPAGGPPIMGPQNPAMSPGGPAPDPLAALTGGPSPDAPPAQPSASPAAAPNPLAALQAQMGPNQSTQGPDGILQLMLDRKKLKDRIDRLDSMDAGEKILAGMAQKGLSPEQGFTGGQIMRNALANFARGMLMGKNFTPIEDEINQRRMNQFTTQFNAAKASVAEKNAQMTQMRNLLLELDNQQKAAQVNTLNQQKNDIAAQRAQAYVSRQNWLAKNGDILTGEKLKNLKSARDKEAAQTALLNDKDAWEQMQNEDPTLRSKSFEQALVQAVNEKMNDGSIEDRINAIKNMNDYFQEAKKLSKFKPQTGGLHPVSGNYSTPPGTALMTDKQGNMTLTQLPEGVTKDPQGQQGSRLTSAINAYRGLKEAAALAQRLSPSEMDLAHDVVAQAPQNFEKFRDNPTLYAYLQTLHSAVEQVGAAHGWRSHQGVDTLYKNMRTVRSPEMVAAALLPYMHSTLGVASAIPNSEGVLGRAGISEEEVQKVLSGSVADQIQKQDFMKSLVESIGKGAKPAAAPTTAPAQKPKVVVWEKGPDGLPRKKVQQ